MYEDSKSTTIDGLSSREEGVRPSIYEIVALFSSLDGRYFMSAEESWQDDRPTHLLQMACEKLYRDKLVRPGITILERMVTRGR